MYIIKRGVFVSERRNGEVVGAISHSNWIHFRCSISFHFGSLFSKVLPLTMMVAMVLLLLSLLRIFALSLLRAVSSFFDRHLGYQYQFHFRSNPIPFAQPAIQCGFPFLYTKILR